MQTVIIKFSRKDKVMNIGFKAAYIVSSYSCDHINPPLVARLKEANKEGERLVREGHTRGFVTYPFENQKTNNVDIVLLTNCEAIPIKRARRSKKILKETIENIKKWPSHMEEAKEKLRKESEAFIRRDIATIKNCKKVGHLLATGREEKLPEPKRDQDVIPGLTGKVCS